MLSTPTILHRVKWPLLAVALALGAYGIMASGGKLLAENAAGEELRNHTTVGETLPSGCPTVTVSLQARQNAFTVTYREPSTTATGDPLTNLSHTTVYLGTSNGQTQAIRIWTKDPRGGGTVTIRNVVPPAPEVRLCVTATNLAQQEGLSTPPAQRKL